MSLPLIPRYILPWRKQMVTVLPGCAVRNLCVAKVIFYLTGNVETGWEFQIMSTEKWCFLSAESTRARKKCFAISPQRCASALCGETMESGSSGAKSRAEGWKGNPTWRPYASCSLAVWLNQSRKTMRGRHFFHDTMWSLRCQGTWTKQMS